MTLEGEGRRGGIKVMVMAAGAEALPACVSNVANKSRGEGGWLTNSLLCHDLSKRNSG